MHIVRGTIEVSADRTCQKCGWNLYQGSSGARTPSEKGSRLAEVLGAALFDEEGSGTQNATEMTPRRSARSQAKHKTGEEEFFNMTYLSNLLPHPQCKKLIEI